MNIKTKLFYAELPEFGVHAINVNSRNLANIPKTSINDLISVDIITNDEAI